MQKIIFRIVLGVLAIGLAFGLCLVGSIALDALLGGGRVEALTNTSIANANGPAVRAYVARPATPGPHPTVIMIHEFWGLRPDLIGKAEALAQEGYLVIAPDMFRGSSTEWIPRAIYNVVSTPVPQILSDLDAVYAWLATQPDVQTDQVAILGFCFGGRTSLQYSLHNNQLAATVVLYGAVVTDSVQLQALPGPVLGIFGGADASIPLEDVRAFEASLETANIPHQITIYPDQPHAFITDIEAIRRGGAQGDAWNEILLFLKTHLQEAPTSTRTPLPSVAVTDELQWRYVLALAVEHTFGHRHTP